MIKLRRYFILILIKNHSYMINCKKIFHSYPYIFILNFFLYDKYIYLYTYIHDNITKMKIQNINYQM